MADDGGYFPTPGNDIIFGTNNADKTDAQGGDDKVYGLGGNDILRGGSGNDTLDGGEGNDTLYGDAGNDNLFGDKGDNKMYGGAGKDKFIFQDEKDAHWDTIADFTEGDVIDLSQIDAKTGWPPFNQGFTWIGTDEFTGDGQLRYFHLAGNTGIQGNVDGDKLADFSITLLGIHNLSWNDFIL